MITIFVVLLTIIFISFHKILFEILFEDEKDLYFD